MARRMIRAFISIHLPEDVKPFLGAIADELTQKVPPHAVHWLQPDRTHLTLRVQGETEIVLLPVPKFISAVSFEETRNY